MMRTAFSLIVVLALLIGVASPTSAQTYDPAHLHALIDAGRAHMHQQRYDDALAVFRRLTLEFPASPVGYYYLAATYHTMMRDVRVRTHEAQFDSLIQRAITIGEQAVRADAGDALARLYLGGAYGYRGIARSRRGRWMAAFMDGRKALGNLRTAVALRPDLADAYCGIGLYTYWRSVKTRSLWFLPFIGDERRQGIAQVQRAVREGRHVAEEGAFGLLCIYYNEQDYARTLALGQDLHRRFPADLTTQYVLGLTLEGLHRWAEAEAVFRSLLRQLHDLPYQSASYQLECRSHLARCLLSQGRLREARAESEAALTLRERIRLSDELNGPFYTIDEVVAQAVTFHRQFAQVEDRRLKREVWEICCEIPKE